MENEQTEKKKTGRPRVYNLEEEGKALEEWSKKDTSIYLGAFVIERHFDPDNLSRWADANEAFADTLKIAKLRIAMRLREKIHDRENPYNRGLFHREIGMYDKILRDYERKEKELDKKIEFDLKQQAFEHGKSNMQTFLKSIQLTDD